MTEEIQEELDYAEMYVIDEDGKPVKIKVY